MCGKSPDKAVVREDSTEVVQRSLILGVRSRPPAPAALGVVTWSLHMVPYLLYRVLKYGPLGCIRYIRVYKGSPLKGPY